jgi:hypothetical protein
VNGRPTASPPKSDASRRTVALPAWLVDELAAHLARAGLTAADPEAIVFPSPQGGLWSYSNFRERFWNPACVAAGLGEWPDDDDLPRGTRTPA